MDTMQVIATELDEKKLREQLVKGKGARLSMPNK